MQLFYGSQSCSDHCLPDGLSYGFLWWQVEEVGTWGRNSSPWLRAISLASIALILVSFEMELLLEDFDFLLEASFSLRFTDIDRGRLLLVSPAALEDLEVVVAEEGCTLSSLFKSFTPFSLLITSEAVM